MKEKKKNEELQNRREFFKNAAKKALPILGAIALAGAPIISQAAEKEPMGCDWGSCQSSCRGGCMGCSGTCTGGCQGLCGGNCSGSCKGGCLSSCSGGSYSYY